jgi:signal transduction histidine kinase
MNRRILIIDDNEAIHNDFRVILTNNTTKSSTLDKTESILFGRKLNINKHDNFQVDSAFQGQEGLEKIQQALEDNRPYAVAFVDVQMPPGWDGIETILRIWRIDPNIQIVICTAYSDYSWHDVVEKLGETDQLLILKKPFDSIEVRQLACSLTEKWHLLNRLDQLVKKRTHDLNHRIKELNCLYNISAITEEPDASLKNMLQPIVDLVPTAFQYPDITCAKIIMDGQGFCTKNFSLSPWKLSTDIFANNNRIGFIEVYYLEEKPIVQDGPFTKEEKALIKAISEQISRIVERKQAEDALENLNRTLEATVEKLTVSNRELADFAHVAAHDLKSPLRTIGCLAGIVAVDYSHKLDDEGKEQIDLITTRVNRMSKRIDKILQYSEIGRTKTAMRKVNLNTLIKEVIAEITPPENIEIIIEGELPTVICEETRMAQVFQNLLSNSVKNMDKPQGLIKIGCLEENDFWKFGITDNGAGIEEKYFEKIFKIFQTLTLGQEDEAAGIGLSITKKIIETYGGNIWVESEVGKGTTFFFTFPKQQIEAIDDTKLVAVNSR